MDDVAPRAGDGRGWNYADAIVETVREPLLVLDADLHVKLADRAFYQTFKVPPEQTLGRLIYELGDGQWDIPALRKLLEELLPTSSEFNDYQVEHDFPEVGRRTMLLNARRLHDDGKTNLILLAIEDITERRRAELEVARQRTWFQTTLASIGDAVIATDTDGRVTYLNRTAEALTGWTQQQATADGGKPLHGVFNIVNEETGSRVESPVSKALREGEIVGLANHTLLIARDGSERAIDDSAAPVRDEGGEIIGVVMVFHDITERREVEQRLEASEKSYRRLFEAAHDGILILDARTAQIRDVNPFLLEMMDHPREHFIGKELWEIGLFHHKEVSQAAMRQLQHTGSIRYENLPLRRRDGRQLPVEFVSNVYQEDHHQVIQCNIRDISARKAAEAATEAEEANRAKDAFLATFSHEIRTPLTAILGWASLLKAEGRTNEDLQEGLDVIERNARAQAKLIEDVLDVSRIISGKLRLDVCPCDLSKIISAAVDVVRPAANGKDIRIEAELDPSADAADCDAGRVQQVVWNLLSNAIKFTPKGGSVRVVLSRERSDTRITVSDTGIGISPAFLPYVFDRFRQADSGIRRKFGGLGLGLSIVKHLVELHGGRVEAQSAGEGRGSTFTVHLPVRAVHAPPQERGEDEDEPARAGGEPGTGDPAPARIPGVRLDGLRVLAVDDEADARRLIAKVLEDAGATVTLASGAAEALEELAGARPDVLVSDLGMPEMDGFDLIREVRSGGRKAKDLPAVALTAFAHKEDQRRVLLAGFQVHVPKPVDPNDLLVTIASLAGRTG
jgi:PAS domain S-box-containing protein